MTSLNLFIIIPILGACIVLILAFIFLRVRLKGASTSSHVESSFRQAANVVPLESKEIPQVKSLAQLCSESPDSTCLGEVTLLKKGQPDGAESVTNQLYDNDTANTDGRVGASEILNPGWGKWYTVKQLEIATRGFADENIVGEGGYGVVYRGVLPDGTDVAVKNLLNKKGQAEKEFVVEVEAIGRVRHKNLVGLLGYCAEGDRRLLVYEYVDNGNLEQWLHNKKESSSPLSWDIRMRIAIGAAKGLAYLHEGLEPKVVHRDVKSSNILLDKMWNPKVSDFGLAKLLRSEANYVATRVMGTFGYVSPDYANTGMLNATSDVYSYGVLLMEMITGRSPIDYTRPAAEINLVDWLRGMVANRRIEEIVDPRLDSPPSGRALRRALLVCLRCLDLDSTKRPKMGQVVHMLQPDHSPFRTEVSSRRW